MAKPRLPLTAPPSVWLDPSRASRLHLVEVPLFLRCDSRSRYVRPHTTSCTSCITTTSRPCVDVPGNPLNCTCTCPPQLNCIVCSVRRVPGVRWARAASGKPHLWAGGRPLLSFSSARAGGRRHWRCLQPTRRKSQSTTTADPHPLQHGKRAPGNHPPCCGLSVPSSSFPDVVLFRMRVCGPALVSASTQYTHTTHTHTHAHMHTNGGPRHRRCLRWCR